MLQCRHIAPARATRHPRIPIARASQCTPCYNDRTRPEAYCATVSSSSPSSCIPGSRDPRRACIPRRPCHSERTYPDAPVLQWAHASRGARATVIARVPRRTMLLCRHETRDGGLRHLRIPITLATRVALATVIARVPRRTLLQCRHETLDGGSRPLRIPITFARATVTARVPRHMLL